MSDLTGAGMKLAKAKKMVAELGAQEQESEPKVTAPVVDERIVQRQFEALLPSIPNDDSWMNALKSGGILKVDDSSYIAAIRAALADLAGLYDVRKS